MRDNKAIKEFKTLLDNNKIDYIETAFILKNNMLILPPSAFAYILANFVDEPFVLIDPYTGEAISIVENFVIKTAIKVDKK